MKPASGGARILVVDDYPDLREVVALQLSNAGHTVFTAANGREAFTMARALDVDFVISDKEMPDGDGLELLSRLKQLDVQKPLVFLITGSTEPVAELAYAMGAEAVFFKPFAIQMVLDAIARFNEPVDDRLIVVPDLPISPYPILDLTLAKSDGAPCLVGRGGVFVASTVLSPRRGEHLAFTLNLPDVDGGRIDPHPLSRVEGVGIVRWVRSGDSEASPQSFGLEFAQLSKDAARYLAKWSALRGIVPFIPRGP